MIYFDSAATTLQKPPSVSKAVSMAVERLASPGRDGHLPALRAAETAFACREVAAGFFNVTKPENVVFTSSATHGLNIAIKSLLKAGDTVLISGYEHNAVTRPISAIPGITIKVARAPLFRPDLLVERFKEELTEKVRAVVCNHVSNVFGYILPVKDIAALCRRRNVPFILDASQSAGCIPLDFERLGADFAAMPGHKGLYGPQGIGLLLCRGKVKPLLEGGTGSTSIRQEMPDFLPDRLEAGTHNMPGIAGLMEGLRFVSGRGVDSIMRHERSLTLQAAGGLGRIPGIRVFASPDARLQAGVLSFQSDFKDCEELGAQLGRAGIAVRSGLHCAPLAHHSAGTLEAGTVRVSFSAFNTPREVDFFLSQIRKLA